MNKTSVELTGNQLMRRMHDLTFNELHAMQSSGELEINCISPEQETLLRDSRIGAFDFLVECPCKRIGIEVMTRPTKGKLKEKLRYKNTVQEFIFVLPHNALEIYRKKSKNGFHIQVKQKVFPTEFLDEHIKVWLLNTAKQKFTAKGKFSEIFNVGEK